MSDAVTGCETDDLSYLTRCMTTRCTGQPMYVRAACVTVNSLVPHIGLTLAHWQVLSVSARGYDIKFILPYSPWSVPCSRLCKLASVMLYQLYMLCTCALPDSPMLPMPAPPTTSTRLAATAAAAVQTAPGQPLVTIKLSAPGRQLADSALLQEPALLPAWPEGLGWPLCQACPHALIETGHCQWHWHQPPQALHLTLLMIGGCECPPLYSALQSRSSPLPPALPS